MIARVNWHPSPRDLRLFGAVILIAFSALGWWWSSTLTIAAALIVGAIGLTGTRLALPFYWLWMALAFVLGSIMSRVILSLVYFGVMTPMALIGRAIGRDRLSLKKPATESYWKDLPQVEDPSRYERQF